MSPTRPSRLLGTVVILGLALAVTAVLVYQAQVAARGHRLTAEHTLRDYASFADWQFSQQVKSQLLTSMIASLSQPAMRSNTERVPQSLLAPEAVEALAHDYAGWCKCLDSVRYYFRLDWPNGRLMTTRTDAAMAELKWARDTIAAYVNTMPPLKDMVPKAYGSSDLKSRPSAAMHVVITNDSYAMLLGGLELRPRLLVFLVSRSADGQPVVIYGYETPPLPFLVPAFRAVYERGALLPPSLVGGIPIDSVLSLAVSDARGDPLFGSPGQFDLAYSSTDTLGDNFGRLALRVAAHVSSGKRAQFFTRRAPTKSNRPRAHRPCQGAARSPRVVRVARAVTQDDAARGTRTRACGHGRSRCLAADRAQLAGQRRQVRPGRTNHNPGEHARA